MTATAYQCTLGTTFAPWAVAQPLDQVSGRRRAAGCIAGRRRYDRRDRGAAVPGPGRRRRGRCVHRLGRRDPIVI
jgi:hypothetical protein